MGLLFAMPDGITDDLEQTLASIQAWAGKVDGFGKWTDVTFNAGNFVASVGAWTVSADDQRFFEYCVIGDRMDVHVLLSGTATDGSVTGQLKLRLPGGYKVNAKEDGFVGHLLWHTAAAGTNVGLVYVNRNSADLSLYRDVAATAWPTSTSDLRIGFSVTLRVYQDLAV